MGTIIFIIVLASIIIYSLYISSPETKFNKALTTRKNGNLQLALKNLLEIKEQHNQAGVIIAEIKLQLAENLLAKHQLEEALTQLHEVLQVQKNIRLRSLNKSGFIPIEEKAKATIVKAHFQKAQVFLKNGNPDAAISSFKETLQWCNSNTKEFKANAIMELAKIYFQKSKNFLEQGNTDLAIQHFEETIKWCDKDNLITIKKDTLLELAKIFFQKGVKYEQANEKSEKFTFLNDSPKLKNAIKEYEMAISFFKEITPNDFYYVIKSRIAICKIKQGIYPDNKIILDLSTKNINTLNDLMFRYALLLCKKGEISKCEEILNKHFRNSNSAAILQLKTYCKEYYIQKAVSEIEKINEAVFGDSINTIEELYNNFDKIISIIKRGLPNLIEEVEKIKRYLFSKLISQYFENDEFEKVIYHISKFPNFYQQPELLKNVGIACLRLADAEKITNSNFQNIISSWLTAIYSDKVMLNSLQSTSWDDDYSFTLVDSIGSHYVFEHEVENVNFEAASPENISIGETQRELLNYFEAALGKISDTNLMTEVLAFYKKEKETIEKIIKTVNVEILYAPPHFAKQHNLQDSILTYLSHEFQKQEDISILLIGSRYIKDEKPAIFQDYENAQNLIAACINAIQQKDVKNLEIHNSVTNRTALSKFPTLRTNFEAEMISAFNNIIEADEENEDMILVFEKIISISPTKEHLNYQFSNFITYLTIEKINNDTMQNERGLELLIKAYEINKDNARIVQNLATLVRFNCSDMLNKSVSNSCRDSLRNLRNTKNDLLAYHLRKELSEMFDGVMTQIKQLGAEDAKLFEDYIGIGNDDLSSQLRLIMLERFDFNKPRLNSAGTELAEKLKIIYNLIK